MKVASLTMCYPAPWARHVGLFVQRRLKAVAQVVELEVVCPQPCLPPLRPAPAVRHVPGQPSVNYEPMYYLPGWLKALDGRWFGWAAKRGLRRLRKRFSFELIDAHFCWPDGVGAVPAARALGLPVVITLRGKIAFASRNPRIRRQVAWALREADGLIAVSEDLADQARALTGEPLEVEVIPNAVDRTEFFQMDRDEARRQLGWRLDARYVVSVGHVTERKGFDRLLATWRKLRGRCGDVRLVLVGLAAGTRQYRRQVQEMLVAIGGSAVWVGPQDPAAINVMLNAADVFALATATEGCCNAVNEALAVGVPVVATDVGGISEQVSGDELGILVPPEADAQALCRALQTALDCRWDRQRIASSQVNWTWQKVAQRTSAVFERVIQQYGGRGGRRRVLMLLTNAFDPDPRVAAEARTLTEAGCDVTVLAWDRDGRRPLEERIGDVGVRRVRIRSTHGRGLSQMWYLLRYWAAAWWWARRQAFDAVHCHDLDALPGGWVIGKAKRLPVIYDAHEMYTDMMVGHLPPSLLGLLGRLERLLARRCASVIVAGELMAGDLARRWATRPVVVGNYKRLADYVLPEEAIAQKRAELGFGSDVILIAYIANLGRERLIGPLIEAVAGDQRFGLLIGGDGSQRSLVQQAAATFPNIRYLGQVPSEQIPLLTLCADVVYYALAPTTSVAAYSSPNKLYEALAAGKALLAGDFGEIALVVREYDCGLLMSRVTAGEIAEALNVLAHRPTLRRMQTNAARAGRQRYNWELAASQELLKVYADVLGCDFPPHGAQSSIAETQRGATAGALARGPEDQR